MNMPSTLPARNIKHQEQPVSAGWTAKRNIVHQAESFKGLHPPPVGQNPSIQQKSELPPPATEKVRSRSLKIEADGDTWKGRIKPKIRLRGHWLASAGFKPGQRTQVTLIAPGIIELRSSNSTAEPQSAVV
jgi:hypothetical protein